MKKLSGNYNVDGTVVKDNETYLLKDNTTLNNLVVSSTTLKAGKQTAENVKGILNGDLSSVINN